MDYAKNCHKHRRWSKKEMRERKLGSKGCFIADWMKAVSPFICPYLLSLSLPPHPPHPPISITCLLAEHPMIWQFVSGPCDFLFLARDSLSSALWSFWTCDWLLFTWLPSLWPFVVRVFLAACLLHIWALSMSPSWVLPNPGNPTGISTVWTASRQQSRDLWGRV